MTRGLFAGLLFGETAGLPRGLSDLFTRTGTRHMLALSGLHVGLVGVLVARPFGRALAAALGALASLTWAVSGSQRRVRIDAAWPTAALALFFVPLAGYGAPASRAAVALALVVLGPRLPDRVFGGPRRPSAENLIGVALVIELLVDPRAPLTPGVQLSYVATMALVLCGGAATTKIGACVPGLGPVAATTRTGRRRWPLGRALVERARFGVAAALAASLVASFATLPTVWTTFGEYAPVGLVATPVVFLPMAALVAVGWAYAVSPAGTWLEGVLGAAADGAAGAMVALLSAFDRLPLSPCVLPDRGLPAVAIFSALALVALGARRAPAGAARLAVLSGAVLIAPRPWASRPDGLEVYVTDVGDGLAVLLNTGDGSALLLDAGSRDRIGVATEGVTPLLRALDVGRLDLVLSHDHADHARDLGWIARRFGPTRWVGDRPSPTAVDGYGEDALAGARHVRVHGDRVRASGGKARLRVEALRGGPFAGNEGSLVLDVRWDRSVRIVLCGDAEGHGLAALLRTPDLLEHGPIDALLLPHHGSDSPHLGALLDRLEPREVWISSSSPAPPALPECERRRIPSRVTGRDGPFRWSPGIPGISPLRVSNVGSRGNP